MEKDPDTRYSALLPALCGTLNLLYMGRFLIGLNAAEPDTDALDACIEAITDDLRATELLHEAALLIGDVSM